MGYFLFGIDLQLSCNKIVLVLGRDHFVVFVKNGSIEFLSKFSLYSIMFYIVKFLVCNIQYVLLVDSNYIDVLVC